MQVTYIATTMRSKKMYTKKIKKIKLSLYRTTVSTIVFKRFQEFHKPERKALYVFITKDTVIEIIFSLSLEFQSKFKFMIERIFSGVFFRTKLWHNWVIV